MRFFQFLQCAFEFLGIVNGSVERVCQKVLYSEINADHLKTLRLPSVCREPSPAFRSVWKQSSRPLGRGIR